MNPADIAQRLGKKPGHKLVCYGYVGLPVFRVNAECIVLEQTKFGVIEEFVLRALSAGVAEAGELAAFLGLPKRLVDVALADGIRDGSISASTDSKLSITPAGKRKLEEQGVIRPKQIMSNFTYDGLLRKPLYYPESALYQPRQLRSLSVPEVAASPSRGPDVDELDIALVNRAIKDALRIRKLNPAQVLKVERIQRSYRLYLQAVAMQFKSTVGEDFHIEFAIDGRSSPEHDQQFAQSGAQNRSKLFSNLTPRNPASDLHQDLDSEFADGVKNLCERAIHDQDAENLAPLASAKNSKGVSVEVRRRKPRLSLDSKAGTNRAIDKEVVPAVRVLSVLEHHPLLLESIDTAKNRLLIISPWIRADVVDRSFVSRLDGCLSRGVETYIGFGIGEREEWKEINSDCKYALDKLAKRYKNLKFKRLGDTHAKVLLKDDEFFVLTSFNWLSFRGDPKRPFREELGNMIAIPNQVDEFFNQYSVRFDDVANKP